MKEAILSDSKDNTGPDPAGPGEHSGEGWYVDDDDEKVNPFEEGGDE